MIFRRRATALHAARAGAGCLYCLSLGLAAVLSDNPILLAGVIVAVGGAGCLSDNAAAMRRALLLAVPLAALIIVINALVSRDGLTVIVRLGQLPLLGHTDVTLEATVYGAVLALRAVALILCGALYTVAVDPDEVLELFRRVSFRSALTATLATRMVPVLLRDSQRLADAQRCRPGPPPSRVALVRAAGSGVLDRALDVAAALEVRGYGTARRPAHHHRPLGRHDLAFGAAAAGVLSVAVVARITGLASMRAYPTLHVATGVGTIFCVGVLILCALAPFGDRRGIMR